VAQYCRDHLGKKVGDGECAALAIGALAAVGARYRYPNYPEKGDYVWGTLVYVLESKNGAQSEQKVPGLTVGPGDVIQFREARFEGKTGNFGFYRKEMPHHTSVLIEVKNGGKEWLILEQNTNGQRYVVEGSLLLKDLKSGWLRVYRPVPK